MEAHLKSMNRKLYPAHQPMHSDYAPELDVSPFLDEEITNFYQSQVSILRWMVELGHLDLYIYIYMALLSSYLCQPRQGHLEAIYYLYGYLKAHDKSTMVFDSTYIDWREEDFPIPRGMPIQINAFIDASHARNKVTRRSHTGILIYLNTAPVIWHSKAQKTVETSTFGAEFIALKVGIELIKESIN